ncbi:MAG: glycosyltransferase family 9 protein, partial [Fimbriimonadaceae bacterium]
MIRYRGERLPDHPAIAVVADDAIGNFVVATPLLQMLQRAHAPRRLSFVSGPRTRELQVSSDLITDAFLGKGPDAALPSGPYDLVVNVELSDWARKAAGILGSGSAARICGPADDPATGRQAPFEDNERGDLWRDREWVSATLADRYPFLGSGWIGEIFCRLAYLEGPVPRYAVPRVAPPSNVPDVLVAMSASLVEKLWPADRWVELLGRINDTGRTVGLLGAAPAAQRTWLGSEAESEVVERGLVRDLRGTMTLPEVVGALAAAERVLTLDNGILHLSASTDTPVVGLFRYGIHRLWAP